MFGCLWGAGGCVFFGLSYVVGYGDDGSVTMIQTYINAFMEGSYYSTAPAMPEPGALFTMPAGDWIEQYVSIVSILQRCWPLAMGKGCIRNLGSRPS
jgi:hypothetical protein